MQAHAFEVLELPPIRDMIARHATWSRGRDAVLAIAPVTSREGVLERQTEVAEAMQLDQSNACPPLRGLRDVVSAVNAARRGQTLEPTTLLEIAQALRVAVDTRRFFFQRAEKVPRLAARAAALVSLPHLVDEIEATFASDATVRETASPRLAELRQRSRAIQNRVQAKLQGILRSPTVSRMLQEPYVTTRQDRYVLPIKAECRRHFQGIVLDASASGATVFMEPYSVIDMGNELRTLRVAETHEINRILRALSERVGCVADDVAANGNVLALLDMRMAIARFGAEHRARLVPIDEKPLVILRQARHPLLGARAVPQDVEIGGGGIGNSDVAAPGIVVITGPNTGGKTVTLKTVGLLSLMAMCGLPIPVGEGTRIGFLSAVHADIGDEQSIQQNLSTFSSHLLQISRIVTCLSPRALVLLDELGAGTDPREGTALAVSILEHLHARGALVVCTTHFNELKTFAGDFEGAANAAMEFDPETLQPTYRILMGVPGRSCALDIAERLGLSQGILRRARDLLGDMHFGVENLLAHLEVEKEETARRMLFTRRASEEAEALRSRLQRELEQIETERAILRTEAAREAGSIVAAARVEARRMLADARGRLAALFRSCEVRRALPPRRQEIEADEKEEQSPQEAASSWSSAEVMRVVDVEEMRLLAALEDAGGVYREAAEEAAGAQPRLRVDHDEQSLEPSHLLRPGDYVFIPRLNQEATVVEVGRNDVQVLVGHLRMTLPHADLHRRERRRRTGGEVVVRAAEGHSVVERRASVSTRLDLRGMRADEAAYAVDRYLDQALWANVDRVTIVHGKGTGVLLNVVRERLQANPHVDSFRPGEAGEGDWGVTVVAIR